MIAVGLFGETVLKYCNLVHLVSVKPRTQRTGQVKTK